MSARTCNTCRVNGTVVGFLVGGLVYALLRLTFGHASF